MSEKKKLRVLVVPSDTSGCSFFRNTKPHVTLEEMYPDEFTVDIDYQPNLDDDNFLRQYDIIQYHRTLGNYETMGQLTQKLEDMGIVSIMDIDDYWELSRSHPAFLLVKEHGLDKKILNNVKVAKNVTTTTTIFAKEIEKYNKNVYVVPNAIDPKEKQYIPNPEPSKRTRIGYLGGSSHLVDLQNLTGIATKLRSDNLLDKVQLVLCGFDLRGTMTVIDQVTKQQTQRPIKPHESVWYEYEKIFTDNYKIVSPEYKEFLLSFKNEEYPNVENEPYRRVWTKPVSTYASNYNLMDISLAPIEENLFNKCKCIVGNSLVSTNKGFKHIEDIVKNQLELNTELNGVQNKVCNYFKYDNVDTIKITTEDGYEIEGTPHHKIFINNTWVELKDLNTGDTIELTKPEFLQTEYQEVTYPMLLTKNITQEKIDAADENMIPRIRITENWGRLLGYMLGDGCFRSSGIEVTCDKRHTEVVNDVMNLFKSIGLNPGYYLKKPDKRCQNSLHKEGFGVSINATCINFNSIARKYNWCGDKGKTFRIPKVILESPKSVIREFLKGLFESDGSVSDSGMVSFCSKDIELVKQVQTILLGFNIQSNILYSYNKHYRRYYYNLALRREGSEYFEKEIGFVSAHKKEKLSRIATKKRGNNCYKQEMKDTIKTIQYNKNTVYDIEVENVHEYNANGIRNHNSQLKITEAAFHNKAIVAQNFGPYQIDSVNALKFGGEIDPNGNCILVDANKNHKDWYRAIKKLILEPELLEMIKTNLHRDITAKYSMSVVTSQRRDLYHKLVSDLKNKNQQKN